MLTVIFKSLLLHSPGAPLLVLLLGLALSRSSQRWGKRVVVGGVVFLYLTANPIFSSVLYRSLISVEVDDINALKSRDIDVIVVLGTGLSRAENGPVPGPESRQRMRTAFALQQELKIPILVCGGSRLQGHVDSIEMAKYLHELGAVDVFAETRSQNTYENALLGSRILREKKFSAMALVTHDFHVWRASDCFEEQGIKVYPFPVQVKWTPHRSVLSLIPQASSMLVYSEAVEEWVSIVWYEIRY